ncbi:MAG: hypothetical protein M3081_19760 [Gemmatimonadota bacterium]|nr:hypothetical protein [Gemmatimonadota bacterium]
MSIEPDAKAILSKHQRRHVEVVMSTLEEAVTEIEWLASSGAVRAGSLKVMHDDLPPGFLDRAGPLLVRLRERIAHAAEMLGLPPRRQSRKGAVRAIVTGAVIRLEDINPSQLRGYGTVDSRFAAEVQPMIDELRAGFAELGTLLGDSDRRRRTDETMRNE